MEAVAKEVVGREVVAREVVGREARARAMGARGTVGSRLDSCSGRLSKKWSPK